MLIKSSLCSNYIVEKIAITEYKCSHKFLRKKIKATNNKKSKEKVLVSRKPQENQRKNVQREIKQKQKQIKIKEKK